MSKVTDYVDNLFYLMPRTETAAEMRQKLIESGEDKYEALLGWGRSEDEALGIVVSEFGSMAEICAELGIDPIDEREAAGVYQNLEIEYAAAGRRFGTGLTAGILFCVLGLICAVLFDELFYSDVLSAVSFLLLFGIGAAVIVYSSIRYRHDRRILQAGIAPNSTVITSAGARDGKHWAKRLEDLLCSLIMLGCTALFFLLGVFAGMWHPAWVLFPLGGIACAIISTILDAIAKK